MEILPLNKIFDDKKFNVLFLGNGISRCFENDSWKNLIKKCIKRSNSDIKYSQVKKLPYNMQIIAATNDTVDKKMKDFTKSIVKEISTQEKEIFQRALSINVDCIITTNYTLELEQACGMTCNKSAFNSIQKITKELSKSEKQFRMCQYSFIDNKSIFHIHGDAFHYDSMIMGQYYYSKMIGKISKNLEWHIKRYKAFIKDKIPFSPHGCIDSFLYGDVYMLGFGMDFSESDIWYLVCAKKRHFPNTKIYYYMPKEETEKNKELIVMLKAYNVEVISEYSNKNGFPDYYNLAIADIKQKCENQIPAYL